MNESILLVEDNAEVRAVIRRYLEQQGYRVCEASGGYEALRLQQDSHCDLVVADILMPEGDGLELLMELTRCAPDTPTIVITALDLYLESARALGATRTLRKPFAMPELVETVRELIGEPTA